MFLQYYIALWQKLNISMWFLYDHFCLAPTFRENYVIAEKHSTDHVI